MVIARWTNQWSVGESCFEIVKSGLCMFIPLKWDVVMK
jgi:hypothetical protein